jgi:hypothetical protein
MARTSMPTPFRRASEAIGGRIAAAFGRKSHRTRDTVQAIADSLAVETHGCRGYVPIACL